jgi:hypothetical protein
LNCSATVQRKSQLDIVGWTSVANALDVVYSLTSLNGCNLYASIRAGGLAELKLGKSGLGCWAVLFMERSAATLTALDLR